MRVEEHTTTIDHVPVFYRSADPGPPGTTSLYLHDAITSSADWLPFLERTGGLAPDLIGFGKSGKGGHLNYSPEGLGNFVLELLAALGAEPKHLIGHGWGGALALLLAAREPALAERIVLIDPVPLLPGFTWHKPARLWRAPLLGEILMGSITKGQLNRQLRRGVVRPDGFTDERLNTLWDEFDQGTQRALLRLHRAADEARLAELGASLGELSSPALVIWGERDPWLPVEFADAYGAALPNARVERVPDAGHWPWLDQPQVVDRVAGFLAGG